MNETIRVLFLAAEAEPFVKVGGLGDVAGSLPTALRTLPTPVDVRLVLPYYKFLNLKALDLKPAGSFPIQERNGPLQADVYRTTMNKLPVYLIAGEPIARTQSVYSEDGYRDGRKFTFFSLAALELARHLYWQPDILHAHDWHASPAVYRLGLLREKDNFFKETRSLLTVHNLPYLGHSAEKALQEFGLPKAARSPLSQLGPPSATAPGIADCR